MKSFLAACGVEDSLQLVVESQSTNESKLRPLYQPFAIIGRDLRADLLSIIRKLVGDMSIFK